MLVLLVALVIDPLKAPVKVVAISSFVEALYVSPVSVFRGWLPVAVLEKVK
jgi:hypothetical protein